MVKRAYHAKFTTIQKDVVQDIKNCLVIKVADPISKLFLVVVRRSPFSSQPQNPLRTGGPTLLAQSPPSYKDRFFRLDRRVVIPKLNAGTRKRPDRISKTLLFLWTSRPSNQLSYSVFGRYRVWISARRPDILTDLFVFFISFSIQMPEDYFS